MGEKSISGYLSTITEFSSNTTARSRLQSLYSDIVTRRDSNPMGFIANVGWWKGLLEGAAKQGLLPGGDHLVLHVDDRLLETLRWGPLGTPLSIPSVIAQLVHSGELQHLTLFMGDSSSSTQSLASSAMSYLVTRPIDWALGRRGLVRALDASQSYLSRWNSVRGTYVFKSIVEVMSAELAQKIVRHIGGTERSLFLESLFDIDSFRTHFGPVVLNDPAVILAELDASVLVRYLERDLQRIVIDKEVIKFTTDGLDRQRSVTEVDVSLVKLKKVMDVLECQVQDLQSKMVECNINAKKYLIVGQKLRARSLLRFKHEISDMLDDRIKSMERIQSILLNIEKAAGNIEIMRTYDVSAKTLKALVQHPTLQLENIEHTMSLLSEALDTQADIDDSITVGNDTLGAGEAVSDNADAELQDLLRDIQIATETTGARESMTGSPETDTRHKMENEPPEHRTMLPA
ncbi:uncharacterized protein EI90DRAFT_3284455 [Cantharellus anzutake]|uniref:uncharacterized protein n=1 Tax=Cantharellus anzutake TaxID=1750568 RepID=UPI00190824D4|nr:uncharacterized protein EI90DRAFT_3284455 [Cantharellus anzutake]KAF8343905.1 hypothetical protein EI90DRAFT_3284455 [Cantharellus anzutake]